MHRNQAQTSTTNMEVQDLKSSLTFTQRDVDTLKNELETLKTNVKHPPVGSTQTEHAKCPAAKVKSENEALHKKIVDLKNYSRRNNIIIEGLVEPKGENPHHAANYIFHMLQMPVPRYERCHRLGKPSRFKSRPLIIRLSYFGDKLAMFKNTRNLKGNAQSLSFRDDIAVETKQKQAELYPALMYARNVDKRARMVGEKILYMGKLYSKKDLNNMPGIDMTKACCRKAMASPFLVANSVRSQTCTALRWKLMGSTMQATNTITNARNVKIMGA